MERNEIERNEVESNKVERKERNKVESVGSKLIIVNLKEMCWGDAIGKVWTYQYLSEKIRSVFELQDVDLWVNDYWGVTKWLQLPEPRIRYNQYREYYHVMTHHRHWWCCGQWNKLLEEDLFYFGLNGQKFKVPGRRKGMSERWKPMFWDISGLFVRFWLEKWFPPFLPTLSLIKEFKEVLVSHGLETYFDGNHGDWMVFHFCESFPDHFDRTRLELKDFASQWINRRVLDLINSNSIKVILATDAELNTGMFQAMRLDRLGVRIVNLQRINPWVKLYLMKVAGSGRVYGFHSGFTSIVGFCEVVNFNSIPAIMTGPPIVSYSNGLAKIDLGHYRDLCAHADLEWGTKEKYLDWVYSNHSVRYFMYHGLYETLQFQEWNKDESEKILHFIDQVSFTRENCLVPYDAEFGISSGFGSSGFGSSGFGSSGFGSSGFGSSGFDSSGFDSSGVKLRKILPNHEYLWGSDFMKFEMRKFPLLIENLLSIPFKYYLEIQESMYIDEIEEEDERDSNGSRLYGDEGG